MISEFAQIWPFIFAVDLGRYVVTAGLMALLLLALQRKLAGRRIRVGQAPKGQVRSEIIASLRTVVVFSLFGFGIYAGKAHGVFAIYSSVSDYGWSYFAASVALAIVAHDAYFYWTHRAMHHPALFRFFHSRHHRSRLPTPWTAYSFDLPEAVVQAAFWPLFLFLVPMHEAGLFLFVTHMIVRNVMGHCGYELLPYGLGKSRAWGWMSTVTHHDLHHETFRCNYGLYFTWWDRWMGTEHPDYRARLQKAARLSGWCAVFVVPLSLGSPDAHAGPVQGEWATQGFSAKVKIEECADGGLCGRIVWLWTSRDDTGKPPMDGNNPDPALRGRTLLGIQILRGFRRGANGEWLDGSIYNPEDGRTYSATLRVGEAGELRLRGCALAIFCQTHVWRRVGEVCR